MTPRREPEPPDDDDRGPEDIHEFRCELVRRMVNLMKGWRKCPRPPCKRGKHCHATPNAGCGMPPADPPMTPKQWERAKAKLHRALQAQIARNDAAQSASATPPPRETSRGRDARDRRRGS